MGGGGLFRLERCEYLPETCIGLAVKLLRYFTRPRGPVAKSWFVLNDGQCSGGG